MNARSDAGVSLIELMVVVVVLAVLAVIGVPTYRQYMQRTYRAEAKSALLQLAAAEERFYLQNNTYTNNLGALGFPGGVTERGIYTLGFTGAAPNATQFTAQATPTPGGAPGGVDQTGDAECASFTINHQGIRTAAPNPNGRCW